MRGLRKIYKNKIREMALIYEEDMTLVNLITIHPLKPLQKLHRIQSGRWKSYEEE